jgi:hypothetical protein
MPPFAIIWNRINEFQGHPFHTIRNIEFTYSLEGNIFVRDGVDWNITINDFINVYNMLPVNGPGAIPRNVNGRSYVWAVLNDQRIVNG